MAELYYMDGKKKVAIQFSAEVETEVRNMEIAQHPIEGKITSSHAKVSSTELNVDAVFSGKNYASNYAKLVARQEQGRLLTFAGLNYWTSNIIGNISKPSQGWKNGIKAEFTLVHIDKAKVVRGKEVVPQGKAPTPAPPPEQGTFVTTKPGDTYWGWMVEFGTPLDQLRAWNNWADRLIPIGAKARVK